VGVYEPLRFSGISVRINDRSEINGDIYLRNTQVFVLTGTGIAMNQRRVGSESENPKILLQRNVSIYLLILVFL